MEKIIIIAGPTASGKTDTAVSVAELVNGEIICADSMQIYRYMDIGTAKVTSDEMRGITHYMYDIVDPAECYSVSDYVENTKKLISDIIMRGKTPVIVGGTGLYIESLIYPFGLGGAKSDEKIKKELEIELAEKGAEYMHEQLKQIDPQDAEKIHPNNTKRLLRALEIYRLTGKTKSESSEEKILQYDVDMNILTWDREVLYDRINRRVDIMFENGLVDEIKSLLDKGYYFDLQSMQAIGYKEFAPYFAGQCGLKDVADRIKQNSRNYAKRQITWFKRYQFADFLSPQECLDKYRRK